ncbi:MAG: S8 family serine peptidase, partial [Flavobacteriales bacterium]
MTDLDPLAIERRIKNNLNLYDSTDFPVNQHYVNHVDQIVDSVRVVSRWLNALSCHATQEQIEKLRLLPFVSKVEPFNSSRKLISKSQGSSMTMREKTVLLAQTEIMQADQFHQRNIHGEGIKIAVFDVGFRAVDERIEFKHLHDNAQIESTWDFVGNSSKVYHGGTHGTLVLSCIAGIVDSIPMGLATNATFLLARTERNNIEVKSEEDFWLAAAEWADKNGAHVISSSLGYTNHRYFWEDMDGKTSLVTRAANMAASKGIIVLNSAGNDGDADWQFLGAPADADSVLTIGGIDPWTGFATIFSSFGPTADERQKPNLTMFGHATAVSPKGIEMAAGTSFSCPLVAGFAACAIQANPDANWKEMFELLEQSGNMYPYADLVHGYGVPRAERVLGPIAKAEKKFKIESLSNSLIVKLNDSIPENHVHQEQDLPLYVYY